MNVSVRLATRCLLTALSLQQSLCAGERESRDKVLQAILHHKKQTSDVYVPTRSVETLPMDRPVPGENSFMFYMRTKRGLAHTYIVLKNSPSIPDSLSQYSFVRHHPYHFAILEVIAHRMGTPTHKLYLSISQPNPWEETTDMLIPLLNGVHTTVTLPHNDKQVVAGKATSNVWLLGMSQNEFGSEIAKLYKQRLVQKTDPTLYKALGARQRRKNATFLALTKNLQLVAHTLQRVRPGLTSVLLRRPLLVGAVR